MNKLIFFIIGLIQGVIYALANAFWGEGVHESVFWYATIYFASVYGVLIYFSWDFTHIKRLLISSSMVAIVIALLAVWIAVSMPLEDAPYQGDELRIYTLVIVAVLMTHIVLPFFQLWHQQNRLLLNYSALFNLSWNNTFILLLAWAFNGLIWGLLAIWSALFSLIGIDLFADLFYSPTFVLLMLPSGFAVGVAIGLDHQQIINTLKRITFNLVKLLTPLLALIMVLFILTLPFTGLQPLWNTKITSALLLSVLLIVLLFVNAIYQDGTEAQPLKLWLRYSCMMLVLAMPILSVLSLYSLSLRIDQYGLSPLRMYAMIFAIVLFVYGFGYSMAVLKSRSNWLSGLRPVNIYMSFLIVLFALLLHTPVLDPLSWSAANQYKRLMEARVSVDEFDYANLKFKLGHAGYEKLNLLLTWENHANYAAIKAQVEQTQSKTYYSRHVPGGHDIAASEISVIDASGSISTELLAAINQELSDRNKRTCRSNKQCVLFRQNLDGDTEMEVLFRANQQWPFWVFEQNAAGHWIHLGNLQHSAPISDQQLRQALRESKVQAQDSEYRDLIINESRYRLNIFNR